VLGPVTRTGAGAQLGPSVTSAVMKIAVCVKHVPDGNLTIDRASLRLDRAGRGELNDSDVNAIEEALRVKANVGGEVVVISVGPQAATESLRTALALGPDRAILVSDPGIAGSDLLVTSKILATVLERESPDLILFGQQTRDGGGAMLWSAIADRLRRPAVSQVTELSVEGETARMRRQTEYGDDVIVAALPVLVAVSDAINEPRYASLKGMMGAKKKPLEVLSVSDLGLDPAEVGEGGSKTQVLQLGQPPTRAGSVKLEVDENAAQAVFDYLVEKQLV
jgi:electron transfer flavoprotein beta subunit